MRLQNDGSRSTDRSVKGTHSLFTASTERLISPTESAQRVSAREIQVVTTAFIVMFCTVGLALWGLPYYYDFMVRQFGWTRSQVTSGNAIKQTLNRSGIRLSGGAG